MATFIRPTTVTRVTSGFRTSSRPNHHGVDLAAPGRHEIFAVADGKVTRSYYSDSYGECIMIKHQIDGQTWESVYAHLRRGTRRVKVGDRVSQGQVLGIMGSTGRSTGQHLHFELHRGRWNVNKTNAVDPLDYIGENVLNRLFSQRHKSQGDQVRRFQNQLLAVGEKLPKYGADGIFGDETEGAVRSFQKRRNIQVDGIIGPETRRELQEARPNYRRMLRLKNPFMKGNDVKAIQRVVGTKDDSLYGPKTEQKLIKYQNQNHLLVDGIVGPQTWGHMF
ncbi:peptidoglycan DD-metalloendopeptidase family protein [Evansella tamaricis]|uniref:Peptidoglycan DD-metalloendopeptidase family protein n=1 Tax=Evansella tamaricis TaxID=2069301 RepID=A0ABS6JI36_9BACI|nr:peptidoglycan DD-metalloendopeptidase family protein [Evansella tamaricis]MBU9713301.1 peptidoglycan DD-metalloendopeptidase family protein [Evansella tamaricis]